MTRLLVCLLALIALLPNPASAAAVVSGFNANTLARNDDGSVGPLPLGFEISLFGSRSSQVYVNNNGNVTFDGPLATFTPFNLLSTQSLIIAPFFADVDTGVAGDPVTYGSGTFEGRAAFGVNWLNVDYFSSSSAHTRRNSFQLILVSRADRGSGDFDIVFNYDRIQWEAGTASNGNADGLGGNSARAGYAIGRGAPGSAFELAGSAINGALLDGGANALVRGSRGSTVLGRYVFEIRSSQEAQISTLTPFANASSQSAASDASGNFVVFQSSASNLTSADPNPGRDIFRIDTRTGLVERVSIDNGGQALAGDAGEPSISADGQLVMFVAPDAGVGELLDEPAAKRAERLKTSGNGLFLRNMSTGTLQRIGQGSSTAGGSRPRPSASGSHLIYTGVNTDSGLGAVGQDNVFRVPLTRNGNAVTLGPPTCVSCKTVNGNGSNSTTNSNGSASSAVISGDGNLVIWQTTASNSTVGSSPPCPTATSTVMMRNMSSGALTRLSTPASGGSCGSGGSSAPQASDAGTVVVFQSEQPLLGGDSNGLSDIYALNLATATLTRVSEATGSVQGNGASTQPALSGDGKVVAFVSAASNLDSSSTDSNNVADLHVRSLAGSALKRLSATDTGQQANGASARPGLNFDGSRIVFDSAAGNLAPGAVQGRELVYQRANPLVSGVLKSATWWKADEAGWGLFIFDQGNVLAPAWFTYDTDGEPVWYLAAGAFLQPDGSYRGDLFRFTGVPLAQIVGNAADTPSQVGNMVLRFSGDSALSFQYTVNGITQTKAMTRFPFGSSALVCRASPTPSRAAATNFSDVWWGGASTQGWGLFLNHVGNDLFAVWYTFDTDREPLFLVIATTRQADGSFSGQVFRQRNGTPFSQINGVPPSATADTIGTATFRFSSGESGTFSYVLGAVNQSKPISRLQVGDTASVCESAPAAAIR